MLRVFVSSTSKDLIPYRNAVRDAILKLGMHPVMMEHFPAMDANAVEACKQKVLDCEFFVGIYAHRYGHIPKDYEKSITELEYDWAQEAKIPQYVFVLRPGIEWPSDTDSGTNAKALVAFKNRIGSEHVWSEFEDPNSLAAAVTQSLAHVTGESSKEQIHQRRAMLAGLAAVGLMLMAVFAAVIFTQTDSKEIGISLADRASTNQAIALAKETATAIQWTLVPTSTKTATPRPTFGPSPTPLARVPAADDEVLALVAQFNVIDEDAPSVDRNLISEFRTAGINLVPLPYALPSGDSGRELARAESDRHNATLVIWGEIAQGGVRVFFEVTPRRSRVETIIRQVSYSAADISSFESFVFEGMGLTYIVDFVQGQMLYFEDEYEKALHFFESAKATIEPNAEWQLKVDALYFFMGRCFQIKGWHQTAIDYYTLSLALNPLGIGAQPRDCLW